MRNKNEFIVYQNRWKTLLYGTLSALFAGIGIYLYEIKADPELVFLAYYLGTPLFSISALFLFKKYTSKDPILIINTKGIHDRTSLISPDFLPWDNIRTIYTGQVYGNYFLYLEIMDSDLILKTLPLWKTLLIKFNLWYSDNAVGISVNLLPVNENELLYLISKIIDNTEIEGFQFFYDDDDILVYIARVIPVEIEGLV